MFISRIKKMFILNVYNSVYVGYVTFDALGDLLRKSYSIYFNVYRVIIIYLLCYSTFYIWMISVIL